MTVAELIKTASRFNSDAEIKVAYGRMIHPVVCADVSIDMDTNKANMVFFVDEFGVHNTQPIKTI